MATGNLHISVRVSWWVKPYLRIMAALCELHDCEPDVDKVVKTCMRGVRVKVD